MSHYIGQRLSFDGERCTVKYVGEIEGKAGFWLGVEWDDGMKGKHDGVLGGHRYFACQSPSKSAGSFIRPSRRSDTPLSFLEAVQHKYSSTDSAYEAIQISGKTVEEVGFEKIQRQLQNYEQLTTVILDRRCIHVEKQPKKPYMPSVRDLCPQVQHLDISLNLLERWEDVLSLCVDLEHLKTLSVAGNRFSQKLTTSIYTPANFWGLLELGLQNTLLSWEEITVLVYHFPSLKTLNASSNNITHISGFMDSHKTILTLEQLDLSYNKITSVQDIAPLSKVRNLKVLSLRSNPINNISMLWPPDISFSTLTTLDLTGTSLPDMKSLDPIRKVFPSLKSLQTKDTPLSKMPSATLITIARLPTLTELNHSPISAEERQNAEIFYLDSIARELETTSNEAEDTEVLLDHPLWPALCETYGTPTIQKTSEVVSDPNTLAARVTIFTFYLPNSAWEEVHRNKFKESEPLKSSDKFVVDDQQQCGIESEHPKAAIPSVNINHSITTSTTKTSVSSEDPLTKVSTDMIMEKSKHIPLTTSTYALQGIVGRLFSLDPPFTTTIRLFYETDEWDPVANIDGADDGWSVSEDESEDDSEARRRRKKEKGKMIQRKEELIGSTKPVGDWITAKHARVKVELV